MNKIDLTQDVAALTEHHQKAARYGGHGKHAGAHSTGAKMPQSDFSENGSAAGNDPAMSGDYGVVDTG